MMVNSFKRNYVTSFDGTPIYYERQGRGLDIVLCNGVGCTNYAWKYIREYFGNRYRILWWDYRGHGLSGEPADPEAIGPEDCVRDMELVMNDAGIERAVFMGHSMGTQVIFEFYHQFPERVVGLVSICGSAGRVVERFRSPYFKVLFPFISEGVHTFHPFVDAIWKNLLPTDFAYKIAELTAINGYLMRQEDFMPYFEGLSQVDPELFIRMVGRLEKHTKYEMLQDIRIPSLIVNGSKDNFFQPDLSYKMYEQIPTAEYFLAPHATHAAPLEVPEAINLRIEKFLSDHY